MNDGRMQHTAATSASAAVVMQLETLRLLASKGLLTHEEVQRVVSDSQKALLEPQKSELKDLASTILPDTATACSVTNAEASVSFTVTPKQVLDGQRAVDAAALKAILFLARILNKRGLMTPRQSDELHEQMISPLNLDTHATNPIVQSTQRQLDYQFAKMRAGGAK